MTDQTIMIGIGVAVVSSIIGAIIGERKGRPGAGFVWGLLLGPLGWLVVGLGPHMGRKCPECLQPVPEGARRCRCGVELPSDA